MNKSSDFQASQMKTAWKADLPGQEAKVWNPVTKKFSGTTVHPSGRFQSVQFPCCFSQHTAAYSWSFRRESNESGIPHHSKVKAWMQARFHRLQQISLLLSVRCQAHTGEAFFPAAKHRHPCFQPVRHSTPEQSTEPKKQSGPTISYLIPPPLPDRPCTRSLTSQIPSYPDADILYLLHQSEQDL